MKEMNVSIIREDPECIEEKKVGSIFTIKRPTKLSTDRNDTVYSGRKQEGGKTKKKKTLITVEERAKLWNIFEDDKKLVPMDDSATSRSSKDIVLNTILVDPKSKTLESHLSITSSNKEIETCHLCNSDLIIRDNGFPTCTSTKCGIMYKDILDYSPEWRFYGADDNNPVDPTRCGNPINPPLVASPFACKKLWNGRPQY